MRLYHRVFRSRIIRAVPYSKLHKRVSANADLREIPGGWRFGLEAGGKGEYRLAQLDDYLSLNRSAFPHKPPFSLSLRARAAQSALAGTWGIGLWNDPFGLSLGFGAARGRLPTLPNAAWFFFASSESHLSLRDEQPGTGALAAVYRSPHLPTVLLAPAVLIAPLLIAKPISRIVRKLAAGLIRHKALQMKIEPSAWHEYHITWQETNVEFNVDGSPVFSTSLVPRPPLGLVLWLDNQYAAWRPDGRFGTGTLTSPRDCWVEITDLQLSSH